MSSAIGKCKNCKHWDLKFDDSGNRQRECDGVAVLGVFDAAEDDGVGVYVKRGDGEEVAGLRTGPEFGCTSFMAGDVNLTVLLHMTTTDGASGVGVLEDSSQLVWNRQAFGDALSASLSVFDTVSQQVLEVSEVDGDQWRGMENNDLLSVVSDKVRRGMTLAEALEVAQEVKSRIESI